MTLVHRISAALVILLGLVHIAMAPVFFDELAMRVMWCVAQGLLAVMIGIINFAAERSAWIDRPTALMCHCANGLGTLFVALYSVVDRSAPSYVAIVLLALLAVSAPALHRRGPMVRPAPAAR